MKKVLLFSKDEYIKKEKRLWDEFKENRYQERQKAEHKRIMRNKGALL